MKIWRQRLASSRAGSPQRTNQSPSEGLAGPPPSAAATTIPGSGADASVASPRPASDRSRARPNSYQAWASDGSRVTAATHLSSGSVPAEEDVGSKHADRAG